MAWFVLTSRMGGPFARRVLLAELNSSPLDGLQGLLTRAIPDVSVDRCSLPAHAMAKLKADTYQAAIYSAQLAAWNDYWLLTLHQSLHAKIPFIVTVGLSDHAVAEEALEYGAFGVLVTPLHSHQVLEVVQPALHLSQLRIRIDRSREWIQQLHRQSALCQRTIDHLEYSVRLLTRVAEDIEMQAKERAHRTIERLMVSA